MRYIVILFCLISIGINAQTVTQPGFRDYQISGATLPDSILYIMGTDTLDGSAKQGLGKWHRADLLRGYFADTDWLKLGSSTLIPTNSDSAYRSGYTLFKGLYGGLATKIEMLKDGVLQFDQVDADALGRYLIKSQPQQQTEGNTDFNFTTISQPNTGIDRNNDVFSMGWNLNPGGGVEVANKIGFGMQFEGFYRTSGSDYGEWHIVHIDTFGVVRKPITWFLNHYNPALWTGDFLASEIQLNDPTNNLPYVQFARDGTTAASIQMLGSASGNGAEIYLDDAGDNMQITSYGMTNPHLYLFDNVATSYVHMNYLEFLPSGNPATSIVGRGADNLTTTLTYAALADSLDYRLMDHDWYEVGGTSPPNAITDEMFHSGNVSIGLIDPDTRLHIAGTSADPDAADESRAMFILEGDATNALFFGSGASAPYGSWIQSGDRNNPGTQYGIYLNPLGGNVGVGNQDPQQTLHVTGTARITGNSGTATAPAGRDADGDISAMTEGWGINYTGGAIVVDSSQVATQYDLTTVSGGATDLTIGGSGPTYTIESSTGADVTISAGGINALSESPANTLVITATEVDGSTTNELQDLSITGASSPFTLDISGSANDVSFSQLFGITLGESPANTLTIKADTTVLATPYDISGFGTMSNWLLAASGTGGTETITHGETVTISETTGLDVTRSTNTVSVALSIDEFSADGTPEGDEYMLVYDASGTNHELIDINDLPYITAEVDGSTTNEAWTMDADDATTAIVVSNQTVNIKGNAGIATDIVNSTVDSLYIAIDATEFATVTTAESTDYILMHDANTVGTGDDALEKMLWSEFLIDLISFKDGDGSVGTGNTIDVGEGMDINMSPSTEANINLDASEFLLDGTNETDESFLVYDPDTTAGHRIQRIPWSDVAGGSDTNWAEDNLTVTGNRSHDMGAYIITYNGTAMQTYFQNDAIAGNTGNNIVLVSEAGASGTGIVGGISYQSENSGSPTEMYDIQASKWSSTKSSLTISGEQASDAEIVLEKNADLNNNATESHLSINAGIAYTQNYDLSTSGDLDVDRSYYAINITGGSLGDTIKLPEVASSADNWNDALSSTQVQVGQEYVISNLRSGVNLIIAAYNPAGTSDDLIGTRTAPGGSAGSAISLAPGKSAIIKCYQLAGGIGYWNYWLSN